MCAEKTCNVRRLGTASAVGANQVLFPRKTIVKILMIVKKKTLGWNVKKLALNVLISQDPTSAAVSEDINKATNTVKISTNAPRINATQRPFARTRGVPTPASAKRDSLGTATNALWMKFTRRNKRSIKLLSLVRQRPAVLCLSFF